MKEFTVVLNTTGDDVLSKDFSMSKPLIPIGNRPLIWYSIQIIQSHSSLKTCPLLILTSISAHEPLKEYLTTLNLDYQLIVYSPNNRSSKKINDSQQQSNDFETINILRCCYSHIHTESICLLNCDLFGKINLIPMINMFRIRDASLMMFLIPTSLSTMTTTSTSDSISGLSSATSSRDQLIQPGQKVKYSPEIEYYTVDPATNTVTSIQMKSNLDDYFPFEKDLLIKYPRLRIRSDLIDSNLYLMKKNVLDIALRSNDSSFRSQFLPKLVRQLCLGLSLEHLITSSTNVTKTIDHEKFIENDDDDDFSTITEYYQSDKQRVNQGCYYSISETSLLRIDHPLSYLEANRQASGLIYSLTNEDIYYKDRSEPIQVSGDSIIGEGTELGKRITIKKTIIGKNCRIEDKCKIINCVLLDNVHVKEGVNLQNSILCFRSIIGNRCEIFNSIVCSNQQVDNNKKLNGETISANNHDGDIFIVDDDEDHYQSYRP